jgi:hypothetical protein
MTPINITYIANKDTTDFNNNSVIKKGTIVQGAFAGSMPNGEIRITTTKGEIIKETDLQEQSNNNREIAILVKPNLSPEEKFYQSLGITTKGGYDATVKAKGRLLVAVVLVAGYFAYKKFKK